MVYYILPNYFINLIKIYKLSLPKLLISIDDLFKSKYNLLLLTLNADPFCKRFINRKLLILDMQKIYTGRAINIPALAQEINNLLLSEGWESTIMQNPVPPAMPGIMYYDYTIRAMKKGHFHHVENIIIRITGQPNDFKIVVEEEHIGPLGRELINHRLFTNIDKQINDGLFDLPAFYQQPVAQQPIYQQPAVQQPMTQGIRCPNCGTINPPTAKFCVNCGTKLS